MRKLLAALLLLTLASTADAQTSVRQSGNITPGHAVRWLSTGVIADAGTATNAFLTSIGVQNNGGPGICVNSGPQTGPYNQLCLAATTNGGAKISSYIYGGATNPGITFDINGSLQGFLTATLPVSSGDVACFSGTTGNIANCGFPGGGISADSVSYTASFPNAVPITQSAYDEERVSIVEFGAVADATTGHATVNAAAFANALATGKRVWVPYNSLGYNIGSNSIALSSGQSVQCENQATTIFGTGAKVFYISSLGPQTNIVNCTVHMQGSAPGSTAFRLATTASVVNVVTLTNVKCLWAYECIGDEGTNAVAFLTVDGAYATQTQGRQFHIGSSNGFINLNNIDCDFTNEAGIGLVTWQCGAFTNFIGIFINTSVASSHGSGTPTFVPNNPAWEFSSGAALWINTLFADGTGGDGVLIDNVDYLWAHQIEGSQNLGVQVTISNGARANLTNLICSGGNGITGAASSKNGCVFTGQATTNVANLFTENATGDGFAIGGASSRINISNVVSINNVGNWGSVGGTSDRISIFGGSNTGNAGGFVNSGSGTNICLANVTDIASSCFKDGLVILGGNTIDGTFVTLGNVVMGSGIGSSGGTNFLCWNNGSGAVTFSTATCGAGLTITTTTGTLTIANGKTLTASNSLTLTGTDATSFAFPSTSDTVVTLTATQTLTNKTLTSPSIGTGLTAGGNAAISATKTVRAAGGATDCTLIFTLGILTGGSC